MFNLVEHCKTAIYRNLCEKGNLLSYAVFRLERATEVLELTYLGKYFACVNANWYPGKHRSRQ